MFTYKFTLFTTTQKQVICIRTFEKPTKTILIYVITQTDDHKTMDKKKQNIKIVFKKNIKKSASYLRKT